MDDTSLHQPLRSPDSPVRKNRNGTQVKFTLILMIFQVILIVLFMALVDYGEHSLPRQGAGAQTRDNGSNKTQATAGSAEAVNDVSIYYPSKWTVVFLVFMLRNKVLKSKFNRPAKPSMSLGVR